MAETETKTPRTFKDVYDNVERRETSKEYHDTIWEITKPLAAKLRVAREAKEAKEKK